MAIDSRIEDKFCSRILLKQQFNPRKDIFVSFQTPDLPRLITEDSNFLLLTESGIPIIVDTFTALTLFVATTGNHAGQQSFDNPQVGNTGIGTGIMALSSTGKNNLSGHIMSVCLDFFGGYGLNNMFKDAGNEGNTELIPSSMTVRLSSPSTAYSHLSTKVIEDFDILTTDFKQFRFSFKEHLNRVNFDVKRGEQENYVNAFSAVNTFPPDQLPDSVFIGIASSSNDSISLKDITYSGNLSGS